jgi:hypothetical protein
MTTIMYAASPARARPWRAAAERHGPDVRAGYCPARIVPFSLWMTSAAGLSPTWAAGVTS